MRFCQISNHPPAQLAEFYAARPHMRTLPFKELTAELAQEAPDASALWMPTLGDAGHDARLIVANDAVSQGNWAGEKLGLPAAESVPGSAADTALVLEQLRKFKPDVLCITDPVTLDSRFVCRIKRRPATIIGWTTQLAPQGTDWSGYDLMLSPYEACVRQAWRLGARDARLFPAAFPRSRAEHVCQEPKTLDVVYFGRWRPGDGRPNDLIVTLANAALREDRPFVLGLHLDVPEGAQLPPAVLKLRQGPLSGPARSRALSSARLFVTEPQDPELATALPSSILEGTGIGVCTIAAQSAALSTAFKIGTEIVICDAPGDMVAQIDGLLADAALRDAIAKAGQERCLTEHSMEVRMRELLALLRHRPGVAASTLRRAWHRVGA